MSWAYAWMKMLQVTLYDIPKFTNIWLVGILRKKIIMYSLIPSEIWIMIAMSSSCMMFLSKFSLKKIAWIKQGVGWG